MAEFDSVVIVDWSSASVPKTGKDSIWIAWHAAGEDAPRALENPPTRAGAEAALLALLSAEAAAGRRVLVGFDFPFGYPEGFAEAAFGASGWRAVWGGLCEQVQERPGNLNNRLAVAAQINRRLPGDGPFWGHPPTQRHDGLPTLKPKGDAVLPEWRAVEIEARARGARPKSCWQLNGAGAVGGQVLTGIPAVARLRGALDAAAQVWPFETGLAEPDAPIVFAEIYPSLVPIAPREGEPKDAAQVRATAAHFLALQAAGRLAPLFAAPGAEPGIRSAVALEEAWILGLERFGEDDADLAVPASLDIDLAALESALRDAVAEASGRSEDGVALALSPGALEAALRAFASGAPVLCDGPMTLAGAAALGGQPASLGTAAPAGAVLALGEDPTALARLAETAPDAVVVLAFTPGLTGVAEAKTTLAAGPAPLIHLPGGGGGPGLAVAALRALAQAAASLADPDP
ncbi:MAG: precorrin-8X methylmutase [Pseudomonadota bacterium]